MSIQRKRKYSFQNSKKIAQDKCIEINNIKIYSVPGTCYHAIMCALAQNGDLFCSWEKIYELTERYIRQYGGTQLWEKFVNKKQVSDYKKRIRLNTYALTRSGKHCYGYRLHEQGIAIYYYDDGAAMFTGGVLKKIPGTYKYDVVFPDGKKLQTKHKGSPSLSYRDYKKYIDLKLIDNSGNILNEKGFKKIKDVDKEKLSGIYVSQKDKWKSKIKSYSNVELDVCVSLKKHFTQKTAGRLENLGLFVDIVGKDNELIGTINSDKLKFLQSDPDVECVEIAN